MLSEKSIKQTYEKVAIVPSLHLCLVSMARHNKERGAQCGSQEGFERLQEQELMNKYIPIWLRASGLVVFAVLAVLAVALLEALLAAGILDSGLSSY